MRSLGGAKQPTVPLEAREEKRALDRLSFLTACGLAKENLTFLAGDASFRKYFRVRGQETSYVLMDAPPPEETAPFVQMAHFLRQIGLSAPKILETDEANGFLLLEDFGDNTFTALLKTPGESTVEQNLYEKAVDILIHLHQKCITSPPFLKGYTLDIHVQEASVFMEWAYETIHGQLPSADCLSEYQGLWQEAFAQLPVFSAVVLRDYHVDNLMLLPERQGVSSIGLLDFQDALWGSPAYDLVSLLEDARRDVPEDIRKRCWARYGDAFPEKSLRDLQEEGAVMSAARHAKIIGIFNRLDRRDGKPRYLVHLPRVGAHLRNCLDATPLLQPLKKWFHFYGGGLYG